MSSVRPKLKPDTPTVVTAWDVRTGATVYRLPDGGWSEDVSKAAVLSGDDAQDALEAAGKDEGQILDPYVMEVTPEGDVAGRETLRETIRANGPTIHPEYAKTARGVVDA
ncbi:MAG: hypothetical protein CMK07_01350 [Ponticaulis sp.]|nr:hypothetical protein [Ponticaulis sp.]